MKVKRQTFLSLIMIVFLFSMVSVQPVKAEWTDTVEIYHSSTPDSHVGICSPGTVNWKIRWLSNQTEITRALVIVNVFGVDVDQSICASYELDCWQVNFASCEVKQLVFSISFVDCYGITNFTQTASNVMITWDQVIINGGGEVIPPENVGLKELESFLISLITYCMMALVPLLIVGDMLERRGYNQNGRQYEANCRVFKGT